MGRTREVGLPENALDLSGKRTEAPCTGRKQGASLPEGNVPTGIVHFWNAE